MNYENDAFLFIEELEKEMAKILERVPPEHRGLLFERTLQNFRDSPHMRRLELAFAEEWASQNMRLGMEPHYQVLLRTTEDDPQKWFAPRTEREWLVVQVAMATFAQWLGTAVGSEFLHSAFKRAGGKFRPELPPIKDT